MTLPNRSGNAGSYRYGFQGQEKDDEIKGEGNSLNYKYRMHDPRVGRFFAVDPLTHKYPHYSPYAFSGNKVISHGELEGLEEYWVIYGDKLKVWKGEEGLKLYSSKHAAFKVQLQQALIAEKRYREGSQFTQETRSKAEIEKQKREIKSARKRQELMVQTYSNPGMQVSYGVLIGFGEAPAIIAGEYVVDKAIDIYQLYRVFKQSKLAAKAVKTTDNVGGGINNVGNKNIGLRQLSSAINPTRSKANCVSCAVEFHKALIGRVFSEAKKAGGRGLKFDDALAFIKNSFDDATVTQWRVDPTNLFKNLNKLDTDSVILFSHFDDTTKATIGFDAHAFNAVKENGIWRLYDVQNGSEISWKYYKNISKNFSIIRIE
ncbi:RHS repeat-associated core domain-containing protein [Algibacter sp. 2305UL17-15]|uniref:RHS repeat-associated core domain-containing protein n=1 Tax=Algibacter sp. 2305UL17-15 TaxID=3231268 RepID=UPI0034598166